MNTAMTPLVSGLLYSAPLLIVYLVALIMSVIFWSDYPQTCAKVLAAAIILLLTTLVQPVMQQQAYTTMRNSGGTMLGYSQMVMVIGIIGSIFRAAGFALLTWAAFAGRAPAQMVSGFPPIPPRVG
jgi:hypothetical protein